MAALRNICLLLALLLLATRLFTGIVYEHEDPTTYLVLKHAPSFVIAQQNHADTPVRQHFTIIDGGENELAYQGLYTFLMRWAFGVCAVGLGLAYVFDRSHGRR
jgi:hypothetical protein